MKNAALLLLVCILCGTSLESNEECGCTDAELNFQGEGMPEGLTGEE